MNKNTYIVYKHTSPDNKVYIGITSNSLEKRSGHNGIKYKKNRYFYSAIKKYGWENFTHEILCSNLSKEKASDKEKYFVKLYHSNNSNCGYNFTSGGEIHFEFTKEIKDKISEKTTEQWKNTDIRNKMIESLKESHQGQLSEKQIAANAKRRGTHLSDDTRTKMKGRIPWNKGKKGLLSTEALEKMRTAHIGISPSNKGTHLSEEQKIIVSQRTKEGMNNPNTKQKIIDSNKRRTGITFKNYIVQYDLNDVIVEVHAGEANASRKTGIGKSAIHNCVSGKTQTAGGYKWKKLSKEKYYNEKII